MNHQRESGGRQTRAYGPRAAVSRLDEYPETGIEDHEFPHETSRLLGSLLLMPVRKMIYPLRRIGRELKKPRMD